MRVAFGEYQLDTKTRTLQREGRRIPVQSKAFDLLAYLIERRDQVVSSDELLDALWPGLHVTPAALSTAVQKARQAVGDDGEHQTVLHTEHGKGFRFVAEVGDLSEPEAAQPKPASFRTRIAAVAGIAALLLVVALIWLSQRQTTARFPSHSLAVLPFANMSADPDQEYFADGIAEELLNKLARFEGLRVVGRTSSFSFRDSDADLKAIGEALGVDVILEGSVRKAGNRVRITAQLVSTEDGFHRWSETYDHELGDIFAIQTEIATAIAEALRVSLSSEERDRMATAPTQNLAAYQTYLLGKQRMTKRTSLALAESVDYFQQAVELDPAFALAYVGLADSYLLQAFLLNAPRDETLLKARAAVDEALELDARLGEAHTTLAFIFITESVESAEATFQRALELNPNYVTTYLWYGLLLRDDLGRPEDALVLHRQALELDPLSAVVIANIAEDLAFLGRFDEALAQHERTLEIDPGFAGGYVEIGMHHWQASGRLDEAALWLGKSISFDPGQHWFRFILGLLLLDLGDVGSAEYAIKGSIEFATEDQWANFVMQLLHLYRGDEAAALHYGRKVFQLPNDSGYVFGWLALVLLRDHELKTGRYAEALALYEDVWPDILRVHNPTIDNRNYRAAIDLALVLFKTGEPQRANLLLDRSFQHIHTIPRLGWFGYGIADVQIHALQGNKQKALSALRQAIDEGWRFLWWYFLKHDPNLESLHGEPEYQAMVAEIEADMATQLARVREMERNGELEPIPEVRAAIQ